MTNVVVHPSASVAPYLSFLLFGDVYYMDSGPSERWVFIGMSFGVFPCLLAEAVFLSGGMG